MINSIPELPAGTTEAAEIDRIVQAGPRGAVALAGLATGIVVALWLAFYVFVFLARVTPP
jgi:hypothetical protein